MVGDNIAKLFSQNYDFFYTTDKEYSQLCEACSEQVSSILKFVIIFKYFTTPHAYSGVFWIFSLLI
jgi:hypothetical protein